MNMSSPSHYGDRGFVLDSLGAIRAPARMAPRKSSQKSVVETASCDVRIEQNPDLPEGPQRMQWSPVWIAVFVLVAGSASAILFSRDGYGRNLEEEQRKGAPLSNASWCGTKSTPRLRISSTDITNCFTPRAKRSNRRTTTMSNSCGEHQPSARPDRAAFPYCRWCGQSRHEAIASLVA